MILKAALNESESSSVNFFTSISFAGPLRVPFALFADIYPPSATCYNIFTHCLFEVKKGGTHMRASTISQLSKNSEVTQN